MRVAPLACASALLGAVSLSSGVSLAAAGPPHWKPEAATYGVGEVTNVAVTMSGGTVLRVDEYYDQPPRLSRGSRRPPSQRTDAVT